MLPLFLYLFYVLLPPSNAQIINDTYWFIATSASLNWTICGHTPKLDIVLSYKIDTKDYNWTIITGVLNNGQYDLQYTDFNLTSNAFTQFNISQNTTAQFMVKSSDNKSICIASPMLYVLHSIQYKTNIIGKSLTNNNQIIFHNLMINKYIYNNNDNANYTLTASLINLNPHNCKWNTVNTANITISNASKSVIDSNNLYYIYSNITITILSSNFGGPYYLQIGLIKNDISNRYNMYAINYDANDINNLLYQYILYDESLITFNLSKTDNIRKYDDILMSINIGNTLNNNIKIYATLNDTQTDDEWIFNCDSLMSADYNRFGWKFMNKNGNLDRITNGIFTPNIYWDVSDDVSKSLSDSFRININNNKNVTINSSSSSSIIPAVLMANDNNFTFNIDNTYELRLTTSYNIPTNLSLQYQQCIDGKCEYIGNTLNIVYEKDKQKQNIIIPSTLKTNYNGNYNNFSTFIVISTDLCLNNDKIITKHAITIMPLFRRYIIGDIISNVTWNTNFTKDNMLSLSLLYNNSQNRLDLGMINNTGLLMDFQPNLTQNAKHLLIENNSTGVLQLSSSKDVFNISYVVFNLSQPLILNVNVTGSTIAKDSNKYISRNIVNGKIFADIVNNNNSFIAYLTNITDNKSLNISRNTQYALNTTNINITCSGNDYCDFNLTIYDNLINLNDNSVNGEYILGLTYADLNNNNIFSSNYFVINNFVNYSNSENKFLLYSSSNIMITINDTINGNINAESYQYSSMNVAINDNADINDIQMVYLVLQDQLNSQNKYIFDCIQQVPSYYTSFGWIFNSFINKTNINIINGSYSMYMYWYTSYTLDTLNTINANKYQIETDGNNTFNINITMKPNDPITNNIVIISIKNNINLQVNKGDSVEFTFKSSVNIGNTISVYYQQCKNDTNRIYDCISYYPRKNGEKYHFVYKESNYNIGQKETIKIPNNSSLKYDPLHDYIYVTYIVSEIQLCDKSNIIQTKQQININGVSSSSSKLSLGAIIGIICAALLVFGLAAWWLCMRNSSGDGYRTLDE